MFMLKKGMKVFRKKSWSSHDNSVISSEVGLSVSTSTSSNQVVSGIWLPYLGGGFGKNMSVTRFVHIL